MVQILEDQSLYFDNLLSYSCTIEKCKIFSLADFIDNNIKTLGTRHSDKTIISIKYSEISSQTVHCEILIPVTSNISDSDQYKIKKKFRLIHSIKIRHEGTVNEISVAEKRLCNYIEENSLEPLTDIYYVLVRRDKENDIDNIFDIYIGINYNIL